MSSLTAAMEIGRQALLMRQRQMNVTGHNLANADRVGYHRQSAEVESRPTIKTLQGQLGTGASVVRIVRDYHQALEASLQQAGQETSYHQTLSQALDRVEGSLAPMGQSELTEAMNRFSAGWQQVSAQPESREQRLSLLHAANDLAARIRQEALTLEKLQASLVNGSDGGELGSLVTQVNTVAKAIADLNRRITAAEGNGLRPQVANDLRDDRDRALRSLSELVSVEATEQADGQVVVNLGGRQLVNGAGTLALESAGSANPPGVAWADTHGLVLVEGGSLGATLTHWQQLQGWREQVDGFAALLVTAVNGVHEAGFTVDGTAGQALFSGSDARSIAVTLTSERQLAVSPATAAPGDGANALAIFQALHAERASLGGSNLGSFADDLVNEVAVTAAQSRRDTQVADASRRMFESAIAERSGVSIDEEMIRMLEYQRAYQASARFVAAVNDMLETALRII